MEKVVKMQLTTMKREGRIQKMCPNTGSTKEMIRKTAWGKI